MNAVEIMIKVYKSFLWLKMNIFSDTVQFNSYNNNAIIFFFFFFLRDFIFKKTLFEKLQYLKQEQIIKV